MEDQDLVDRIAVAAAFVALGDLSQYKTRGHMDKAMMRRVLSLSRYMRDGSAPLELLSAARIPATIHRLEYEESSRRYKVTFLADSELEKPEEARRQETIRTDRTDGQNGELVQAIWDESLVGQHVIIFKANEMPSEETAAEIRRHGGVVPTQGYRRAVYVVRQPNE